MSLIVQKYGGTSVGSIERIKYIANCIADAYHEGKSLVVVVSAMGKTTDNLVKMMYEISKTPTKREVDVLLSAGEQIAISLLTIALNEMGIPALSFIAFQIGILTDGKFTDARITKMKVKALKKHVQKGDVCVVAGFQGLDAEGNITTLGRGGSDTSAVALAYALDADECEIYTDVDGIYTADPNKVNTAKKLKVINYEEMLELSFLGAGVLHNRAVEFAKKNNIVLHVRSSLKPNMGTLVKGETNMEEKIVTGVALKTKQAKVTLYDMEDSPGVAAKIFNTLAKENISVDMIVQSMGRDDRNRISFTIDDKYTLEVKEILVSIADTLSGGMIIDNNISIVSAVGIGMKSHSGVAAKIFTILSENNINIEMISTSEIKISCVIHKSHGVKALRLFHDSFNLGEK